MGLGIFNKLSSPIVLKEDSNAEEQLRQMEYYQLVAPEATKQAIERDKAFVKYGIAGENAIMYELKNSHIPMYIIHDLYLEYNGCTAQIDFLIVTRKVTILIESKIFTVIFLWTTAVISYAEQETEKRSGKRVCTAL